MEEGWKNRMPSTDHRVAVSGRYSGVIVRYGPVAWAAGGLRLVEGLDRWMPVGGGWTVGRVHWQARGVPVPVEARCVSPPNQGPPCLLLSPISRPLRLTSPLCPAQQSSPTYDVLSDLILISQCTRRRRCQGHRVAIMSDLTLPLSPPISTPHSAS